VFPFVMNESPSAAHWPHSCPVWTLKGWLDVHECVELCENIASVLTFLSHYWHAGKNRN